MQAQDTELRKELHCTIYPTNSLQKLKYVVICSYCNGKWLLSKHKKRSTWETQGGHIENGESALDAAKRELFEESGVKDWSAIKSRIKSNVSGYLYKTTKRSPMILPLISEV